MNNLNLLWRVLYGVWRAVSSFVKDVMVKFVDILIPVKALRWTGHTLSRVHRVLQARASRKAGDALHTPRLLQYFYRQGIKYFYVVWGAFMLFLVVGFAITNRFEHVYHRGSGYVLAWAHHHPYWQCAVC